MKDTCHMLSTDRPAHVGDWIKAFLDTSGRVIFIRNIDEEFFQKSKAEAPISKFETRLSKCETSENDQIKKFEFRKRFGFRYWDFELF